MEEKAVPQGSGISFKRVTTKYVVAGGQTRLPAKVDVKKSGAARTSVEATNLIWDNLSAFPKVKRDNLQFGYGVDEEGGNIAIYPEVEGLGLLKVRDWGNSLGFHLGGVFKEYPNLRPNTEVECGFRFDHDAKGAPCFIFNIVRGLAKKREPVAGGRPEPAKKIRRTRKRNPGTGTSTDAGQTAAGSQ